MPAARARAQATVATDVTMSGESSRSWPRTLYALPVHTQHRTCMRRSPVRSASKWQAKRARAAGLQPAAHPSQASCQSQICNAREAAASRTTESTSMMVPKNHEVSSSQIEAQQPLQPAAPRDGRLASISSVHAPRPSIRVPRVEITMPARPGHVLVQA